MNAIFLVLVTLSLGALIFVSPDEALTAMLGGGEKALQLTFTMTSVYALWLGILKIAEDCGLTGKLAKALSRPVKRLFGNISPKASEYAAMNISANLLGMGGIATPMGISAARELDTQGDIYAMNMLFVLAATSLQLLPTSVISLRAEAGSLSAGDVILPTLIATAVSTLVGVIAVTAVYGKLKR